MVAETTHSSTGTFSIASLLKRDTLFTTLSVHVKGWNWTLSRASSTSFLCGTTLRRSWPTSSASVLVTTSVRVLRDVSSKGIRNVRMTNTMMSTTILTTINRTRLVELMTAMSLMSARLTGDSIIAQQGTLRITTRMTTRSRTTCTVMMVTTMIAWMTRTPLMTARVMRVTILLLALRTTRKLCRLSALLGISQSLLQAYRISVMWMTLKRRLVTVWKRRRKPIQAVHLFWAKFLSSARSKSLLARMKFLSPPLVHLQRSWLSLNR